MSANQFSVRTITVDEHRSFIADRPGTSFLQLPAWARVKADWRAEHLGWYDAGGALRGTAQVLHRPTPVVKWTLAYLPEAPVLDWEAATVAEVAAPMLAHFKRHRVFLVRMGVPLLQRGWKGAAVRKALSGGGHAVMGELDPAMEDPQAPLVAAQLRAAGWRKQDAGVDFAAGQPEFQARIPLVAADGSRLDLDGALAQMNQNARREAKRAASGPLEVEALGAEGVERFHALYRETAERDGFTGRPAGYFTRMITELNADAPGRCTLYIASHEGRDLAAAIRVHSGSGAWYVYGASSAAERKLFAPKALIHRMLGDSIAEGCDYLDHGGVSATLDKEHHLAGLTLFKATLGCDVVQTLGEWDYPLNRPLAAAFDFYMKKRSKH
ncbi:lipid II:glycine glycyltransferase FemX [Zafaria sp. Z1313]|uniref:lipid II:glycine glycyltransferase FemX n=1 Tax=unclassified Zafaria TaxID=2828765 RepID=UPI002E77F5F0|nr:peptidoglycan bridge formation glycyltransferase FemA/FemB family protein [Zafaria sp. J156]MEE1621037.1 peptidoglycan bridge formation glycyltransferase FemA/FemB family protein [Zafaria sp. J156]